MSDLIHQHRAQTGAAGSQSLKFLSGPQRIPKRNSGG